MYDLDMLTLANKFRSAHTGGRRRGAGASARMRRLLVALCIALSAHVPAAVSADPPVIMVLGDSLSAGYGIELEEGWVRLMQSRLDQRPNPYRMVNASISGDTTQGALARLPSAMEAHQPLIVVVELGGNDGLRGLALGETRGNLRSIVEVVLSRSAQVLLVGMRLPPNLGPQYTERFHAIYAELAERFGVPLVPFLLEGVALDPELMQADGIHPTARAQPMLVDIVWPYLEPML